MYHKLFKRYLLLYVIDIYIYNFQQKIRIKQNSKINTRFKSFDISNKLYTKVLTPVYLLELGVFFALADMHTCNQSLFPTT